MIKRIIAELRDSDCQLSEVYKEMKTIQGRQLVLDDIKIKLPKFGKCNKVPWEGVSCLPVFDPNVPKPKLVYVWESIIDFSTNMELSEKAFKCILSRIYTS